MATLHDQRPRRGRPRPRHVPLPLVEGVERYEGESILTEQGGDLAVLLWKSCANVTLWAGAVGADRETLFAPGARARRLEELQRVSAEPVVAEALGDIARLLGAPAPVPPGEVGAACRALAQWAEAVGRTGTALAFAQAAALAHPDDAGHACAVGRLARARAEFGRAETWYERAVLVAIRTRDRSSYVRAQMGVGKILWHRGALPSARRAFLRAHRAARRYGLREMEGWALYDLAGVAIHAGKLREPMRYFRAAREALGPTHGSIPRFVNDIACAWAGAGHFGRALPPLLLLRDYPFSPADRLRLLGSIARAAGGAGDALVFDEARRDIEAALGRAERGEAHADTLLELATGAASLGRWDEARRVAEHALRLALEAGEARVRLLAESLLDSVAAERLAGERRATPPADDPRLAELVDELTRAARESTAAAVGA